jgi:hypothetical protein
VWCARHLLLATVVAAPCALAACGTADDRAQARAAVERFYVGLGHGDGAAACAELSQDAVKALVQQEQAPCPQAVRSLKAGGGAIARVQVFVTNAKVDLAGGESAFLDRGPDGWQLSAVGCKVQQKPADRPYDCEVEA